MNMGKHGRGGGTESSLLWVRHALDFHAGLWHVCGMKIFSSKSRPVHLGAFPLEKLRRRDAPLSHVPDVPFPALVMARPDTPESIVNAMGPFQAMMDVLRVGRVNPVQADIPSDPELRAQHLKAFGYYVDASMMGVCALPAQARLTIPRRNPDTGVLARDLRERQTKTLAAGVDVIMANLRDAASAPVTALPDHTHALVILMAYPRDPKRGEPGSDWIMDAQAERACLRATENATVLAEYIRQLGYDARVHSPTTSDVNLGTCAVAGGLAVWENGGIARALDRAALWSGGCDDRYGAGPRHAAGAFGRSTRCGPQGAALADWHPRGCQCAQP